MPWTRYPYRRRKIRRAGMVAKTDPAMLMPKLKMACGPDASTPLPGFRIRVLDRAMAEC
jgi:hypothetical protein